MTWWAIRLHFILLEEYDPFLSLTPLDTFSVFIFCIFLLHAHAFRDRAVKRNGSFYSRSSFARQEEKRAGSYATLLKTPKLGGSVKGVNRDREGWMEYRKGDLRKRLAPSDPLNGFPLSGYGESGWEGSSVLPTPFGADAVTLSPHASTHLSQSCKEANKQTTSDVTHLGSEA